MAVAKKVTAPAPAPRVRKASGFSRAINRPIDLLDDTINLVENAVGVANDILVFGRGQLQIQMQMDKVEMAEDLASKGIPDDEIKEIIGKLPY